MQRAQTDGAITLGRRLQWARELVSGSQSQLARDVGVERSMIQKIEAGQRNPSIFLLQSLCHVLRISPQYLLSGSLQGVDGELAVMLLERHPELRTQAALPSPGKTRNSPQSSGSQTRKRGRPTMALTA